MLLTTDEKITLLYNFTCKFDCFVWVVHTLWWVYCLKERLENVDFVHSFVYYTSSFLLLACSGNAAVCMKNSDGSYTDLGYSYTQSIIINCKMTMNTLHIIADITF